MKLAGNRVIKLVIMLVLFFCMFFANFVSIRMIARYAVDTYFYDKLLVAYNIGGPQGLRIELGKIPVTDKSPREAMLAKDFALELETLTEPGRFLQDKVDKSKRMANSIKSSRDAVIYIMFILFACKMIINFINKRKPGIS